MKRLGAVAATHGAVAVVGPADAAPAMDDAVYDAAMDRVGGVVDVIGPTDGPYAVVRVHDAPHVGDPLYLR